MKTNKLVLTSKRTKYMLFHKHNKVVPTLELKINDSSIDQVSTFNFLGLHINLNPVNMANAYRRNFQQNFSCHWFNI